MDTLPHQAGRKIRDWRAKRSLNAEDFGAMVGGLVDRAPYPAQSVYNWEARGKVARPPVQRALAELGVCEAGDWLELVPEQERDAA